MENFFVFAQVFTSVENGSIQHHVFFRGSDSIQKHLLPNAEGKKDIDLTREYLESEYDLHLDKEAQHEFVVTHEQMAQIKADKSYVTYL